MSGARHCSNSDIYNDRHSDNDSADDGDSDKERNNGSDSVSDNDRDGLYCIFCVL